MGDRRIIDYDPITGVAETFQYEESTDTVYHGFHQSAESLDLIVKSNKWERENKKKLDDNYFDHYAHIPVVVQYEWLYKFGLDWGKRDHREDCLKLLERPEYNVWKCTDRKLFG